MLGEREGEGKSEGVPRSARKLEHRRGFVEAYEGEVGEL